MEQCKRLSRLKGLVLLVGFQEGWQAWGGDQAGLPESRNPPLGGSRQCLCALSETRLKVRRGGEGREQAWQLLC